MKKTKEERPPKPKRPAPPPPRYRKKRQELFGHAETHDEHADEVGSVLTEAEDAVADGESTEIDRHS